MSEKQKKSLYSKVVLGTFSNLIKNVLQLNPNFKIDGKKFIKNELDLTSSEISFNTMESNTTIPFLHKHEENEEVYIGIKRKRATASKR